MKKVVPILAILIVIILNIDNKSIITIPNESIRIRVIANSNEEMDQHMKRKVKNKVQSNLNDLLSKATNIQEVRTILNENLEGIDYSIKETLEVANSDMLYKVNFGYNYFPKKEYKGIEYKEGLYESLVITLGEGKGENFWCVLFPPLCMEEIEESKLSDVEYKSYIKEILDKYF